MWTCRSDRHEAPKIYSRELSELIFVQPDCRVASLVTAKIAARETASNRLSALVDIGILEERKVGRDKLFLNPAFLALLSGGD